jgi:anti-sigma factor RsiW
MNCEVAYPLINVLVDGEIDGADRAVLEEHLSSCAECQSVIDSLRLVDASLTRAFVPERDAARQIADRVTATLDANVATFSPTFEDRPLAELRRVGWKTLVLALVVGFMLALVIFPPRLQEPQRERVWADRIFQQTEVRSRRKSGWAIAEGHFSANGRLSDRNACSADRGR